MKQGMQKLMLKKWIEAFKPTLLDQGAKTWTFLLN